MEKWGCERLGLGKFMGFLLLAIRGGVCSRVWAMATQGAESTKLQTKLPRVVRAQSRCQGAKREGAQSPKRATSRWTAKAFMVATSLTSREVAGKVCRVV